MTKSFTGQEVGKHANQPGFEEVLLQKHELQKHLHQHMELPCIYVNVFVTHENEMPCAHLV